MLDALLDGIVLFSFQQHVRTRIRDWKSNIVQREHGVKYFKVTFKDGKSVTIEKPDDVTEDTLRALWKDGKNLELNEVVYRTEQIASLAEVKPRTPRVAPKQG